VIHARRRTARLTGKLGKRLAQRKDNEHVAAEAGGPAQLMVSYAGSGTCSATQHATATGQRHSTISFGMFAQAAPMAIFTAPNDAAVCFPLVVDQQCTQRDTLSVYAALYKNGQMLGLECGKAKNSRSLYTCRTIPQHLRPTNLQRAVVHPDWIDRFPFPYMRDACISSLDTLDAEQFLGDLFMMSSFLVKDGYDSYDPHGWAITEAFKKKVCIITALSFSICRIPSCGSHVRTLILHSLYSGAICSSQARQKSLCMDTLKQRPAINASQSRPASGRV